MHDAIERTDLGAGVADRCVVVLETAHACFLDARLREDGVIVLAEGGEVGVGEVGGASGVGGGRVQGTAHQRLVRLQTTVVLVRLLLALAASSADAEDDDDGRDEERHDR